MSGRHATLPLVLLTVVVLVTLWSAWQPHDWPTWWLEAGPVFIGVPILLWTYPRFPLTSLAYVCICLHAIVVLVGAHYTYAEVPLGNWARDAFGLERNNYDRLGHVAQGFFPAVLAREVGLRATPLRPGRWLFIAVTSFCLAFSALYELFEWWVAISGDAEDSVAFLATQGDPWDTQWDMFLALCGAIAAQASLSRLHDRGLDRIRVSAVGE